MKLQTKLVGGFFLVVVFMAALSIFNHQQLVQLAHLQDDGAKRAKDALVGQEIIGMYARTYQILADGIINRNMGKLRADFNTIMKEFDEDFGNLSKFMETSEEKALAQRVMSNTAELKFQVEKELFPLLEGSKEITPEIRALDEKIDEKIQELVGGMEKIVEGIIKKSEDGDAQFDRIVREMTSMGLYSGIAVAGLALCLGFFLSTSISSALTKVIDELKKGASHVSQASQQVSSAAQALSAGASEQAASIEETSSALVEMSKGTQLTAGNMTTAGKMIEEELEIIGQVNSQMSLMQKAMEGITKTSEDTQKIVKTIDEIAFQTNLLALNAAVEAARAGEAGSGFAVVADEVRSLAMRSAEAAKNTSNLIENTIKSVFSGSSVTKETQEIFQKSVNLSRKIATIVQEVGIAAREQASGIGQISSAVSEMDKVVQTNAATAEEAAAASEELNAQAQVVKSLTQDLVILTEGKS